MRVLSIAVFSVLAGLGTLAACSSESRTRAPFAETGGPPAPEGPTGALPSDPPPCSGIGCQVPSCPPESPTVIEGDVYDPAGKTKLYNVLAYVPEGDLAPLPKGASCDQCGKVTGKAVTTALS